MVALSTRALESSLPFASTLFLRTRFKHWFARAHMHFCLQFFLPEELAKLDASYVPPTSAAPDAASSAAAPDAASAAAASTSAAPDEASAAPEAAAAEGGEGGAGIGVDGAGDASVQEATFFEKGPAA
jgi:hypothetical protein